MVKNKYREERRRREKNEYACDNISLFQKGKKMKKICCQKETGHRYNAKTRAESARFVIAKWRARCPRYNIIRGSGSTEMIQCIHMHIFNQLKKINAGR